MTEGSNELARELQELLIDTCISFLKEKGNIEVEEVEFRVDNLQESVINNKWVCTSDSYCALLKLDGNLISESI